MILEILEINFVIVNYNTVVNLETYWKKNLNPIYLFLK